MKKTNLSILRALICVIAVLIISSPVYAALSGMTVTSITPPNPNPGDSVDVVFNYCTAAFDVSNLIMAVSTYNTIQPNNTGGQTFKVNGAGMDLGGVGDGTPDSNNAGFNMGDSQGSSHCQSLTWTIHVPNTLLEGSTYYVVVAGRAYDCRPASIDTQNFIAFNTPPPATGCSITKSAEVSPVMPGDLVMYTIDYNFASATNLVISDLVPANCSLILQSSGGTNTGTTAGSTLSWALGDTVARKRGKVWYIVRVDVAAPYSTAINGMAHWSVNEIPAGGDSNDPTVMTTALFTLLKSQSPAAAAAIGDTVTYTLDFRSGGYGFASFDPFDADVSGFFGVSGGGTANPGTWTWLTSGGDGFLYTPSEGAGSYPRYLKTSATDFCFGEIQGDVYIGGTGFKDSLISFRDNGQADALALSYGVGISSDHTPGDLYLQKASPYILLSGVTPFSANSNTWYTIKILVSDGGNGWVRIQAKAWARGATEPGAWQIDVLDSTGIRPACGFVGFQGHPDNMNYYDNLKVIRSNPTNPIVYDTIPAIITYGGGTAADTTHGPAAVSGGMVSWNINTSLIDQAYSLTWWGTVNYCGTAYNKASYDTREAAPPVDSNTTTLNVAICPQTATFTPTFTASPTSTRTFTATPSPTSTFTATPTATATNTPIIPQFSIAKAVSPGSAGRGETVTYTIHYANTGLIGLTNLEVWDTLPAEIENIANVTVPGVYTSATGIINWIIPFVATGASGDVSFTATLKNTVTRDQVIGNRAYGNVLMANSAVGSNVANITANVPLLELTPVTNYPNPFDGDTTIVFDLTILADNCSIKFFTISGEPVKNMDFAEMKRPVPGGNLQTSKNASGGWTYKVYWDGTNTAGNKLSSGVYLYRIKASAGNEEKKAMGRLAILR